MKPYKPFPIEEKLLDKVWEDGSFERFSWLTKKKDPSDLKDLKNVVGRNGLCTYA